MGAHKRRGKSSFKRAKDKKKAFPGKKRISRTRTRGDCSSQYCQKCGKRPSKRR